MPRRRSQTTNRRPQDRRKLKVRGVRRATPEVHKLSRAFIGLAMARAQTINATADAEATADDGSTTDGSGTDGTHGAAGAKRAGAVAGSGSAPGDEA